MSHSKTPYSPNFPANTGYVPPSEHQPANPGMPMPYSAPPMQIEPGFLPAYQPAMNAGYPQPGPMQQPGPIMQQPSLAGWMTIPQGIPKCPPGLEYLSMIDQLLIRQKVELLEAFTGFETKNKYTVKNGVGQKVYYAVEDSDCCSRMCCGPMRPFDMKIFDNYQNEVIHFNRPLACQGCCFPCCLQTLEVSAPPGRVVGTVEEEWTLWKPSFLIKNEAGEVVLRIKGPCWRYGFCSEVKFNVYSKDGQVKLGKISKQWSGLAREAFTDADYFGISFPLDLDVKVKATLLGAVFLIDYMYYEKAGNQERDTFGNL